jgi:hypothetical protein
MTFLVSTAATTVAAAAAAGFHASARPLDPVVRKKLVAARAWMTRDRVSRSYLDRNPLRGRDDQLEAARRRTPCTSRPRTLTR